MICSDLSKGIGPIHEMWIIIEQRYGWLGSASDTQVRASNMYLCPGVDLNIYDS
jgi:hypothetical protein